jgi:hypothetical protein
MSSANHADEPPKTEKVHKMKMKLLAMLTALLACTLAPAAHAQCNYRMNDVGRFHGYLGGPCNGAAQNYAGAYPSRQRSSSGLTTTRSGNRTNIYRDGRLVARTVKYGNRAAVYTPGGSFAGTVVTHSDRVVTYDKFGRYSRSTMRQ